MFVVSTAPARAMPPSGPTSDHGSRSYFRDPQNAESEQPQGNHSPASVHRIGNGILPIGRGCSGPPTCRLPVRDFGRGRCIPCAGLSDGHEVTICGMGRGLAGNRTPDRPLPGRLTIQIRARKSNVSTPSGLQSSGGRWVSPRLHRSTRGGTTRSRAGRVATTWISSAC